MLGSVFFHGSECFFKCAVLIRKHQESQIRLADKGNRSSYFFAHPCRAHNSVIRAKLAIELQVLINNKNSVFCSSAQTEQVIQEQVFICSSDPTLSHIRQLAMLDSNIGINEQASVFQRLGRNLIEVISPVFIFVTRWRVSIRHIFNTAFRKKNRAKPPDRYHPGERLVSPLKNQTTRFCGALHLFALINLPCHHR